MKSGLIENINKIAERIEELTSIGGFLTPEVQVLLEELKNLKIDEIIVDLQKGNYLGNRKIDIDLGLNNNITTSSVSYSHVKIVLNTGKVLNIPFAVTNEDKSTSIFELTSHADIKAYITAHTLFITNVKNTEVTIEEAIGKNPLLIRFRDSDGFASNIDKIILSSYSGNFKEAKPSYFWAKTTSSLETIANRVGDIIALGNDIGSIITLATKRIEIQALNDNLPILINVNADLPILKEVNADLSILKEVNANKLNIDAVKNNETNINAVKAKLTEISNIFSNLTEILNAKGYSQLASEKAKEATDIRDEIINFNPKVVHVAASEPVSISYNSTTGEYTILMPKGLKGDRGEAFKIEASGTLASKSAFDGASKGFAFLSLDESPTKVYFKATDTSGDWTVGIAFGKGDKGERGYGISNISLTNTSNLVDTYTITFEDSTTFTFNVTNGSGDMQTANNLSDVVASIARDNLSIYSKGEIDGFIATINNLITSDDLTLDEFQEIVNFIKQNKSDLQTLDLSNISETLTLKHFTAADKTKLTDAYNVALDAYNNSKNADKKAVNADKKAVNADKKAENALSEAKKKVEKDSAGDITVRLIRSIYGTQPSISSTADICFRNKSDGDNYMRFVTQAGFLNWLIAGGAKLTDTNTHRAISNSTSSSSQSTSASSYAVKIAYDKANAAAKKANDAYNRANKPGFSLYTQTTGSGPGKRTAPSGYQFLCMSAPSIRQSVHVTKISRNGKEITIFTLDARAIWTIIWAK